MRKILGLPVFLVFFIACSTQQETELSAEAQLQKRIEAALLKRDPNRVKIASELLLENSSQQNIQLKEVAAINKRTGLKSLAFLAIPLNGAKGSARLGQWTGWLLQGNCFIHGTFTYFGDDPYDWNIFVPDANQYQNPGFAPRCLTYDQLDSLC
jgi:hypothetical protein